MDSEFAYLFACVSAFLILDFLLGPKRRLDWRMMLWAYLDCVQKAQREGSLDKPRLQRIHGQLHVIGYGQRHPVQTAAEGKRLIVRMNRQAQAHFNIHKATGRPATAR